MITKEMITFLVALKNIQYLSSSIYVASKKYGKSLAYVTKMSQNLINENLFMTMLMIH